jgi:glyoxylate/hydroxypyruvate reductase A
LDLLLAFPGSEGARWHAAFAAALPDLGIHRWPDVPASVDCALVWKPPIELFERVRVRRAIFNLGAGVDALLSLPNVPRDVPVFRLEDAGMAEQMAEYVTLAVLAAYREQRAYAEQQRAGTWNQRTRLRKSEFGVGLLGLGVLGRAVAAALARFGFPLHGWSRSAHAIADVVAYAGRDGLDQMLARSRVLVCMLPSTPDTRGLLDRAALSRLPRNAHLVNVARGNLVVDADLIALLDSGHLASATLDVFVDEPLPASHPFWHHPGITVTPHVSAATLVDESVAQVAAKVRAIARGEPVGGLVDRDRGY